MLRKDSGRVSFAGKSFLLFASRAHDLYITRGLALLAPRAQTGWPVAVSPMGFH